WLTYILSQILSNSIKYHKPAGAFIKISASHTQNSVSLIIEDNGQGIPPEDLPRIFEKGFTGSRRGNRKSTGMGLYLCRKLCRRLGLSIQAQSEPGQGTRIILTFPKGRLHLLED
ncbi:MAG: ATP-binding protein, partial [Firmicutes bacterium]|nr:ATP-binding protein [Bacillota bacterium]